MKASLLSRDNPDDTCLLREQPMNRSLNCRIAQGLLSANFTAFTSFQLLRIDLTIVIDDRRKLRFCNLQGTRSLS